MPTMSERRVERRPEIPLEVKLLRELSSAPDQIVKLNETGPPLTYSTYAKLVGFIWNLVPDENIGGLNYRDPGKAENALLDLPEDAVVSLVGLVTLRESEDVNPNASQRAQLVLDHEQEWFPGLPERYHTALTKVARNEVMPSVSSRSSVVALVKQYIKRLLPKRTRD